jgi:membrane fusion protein (multidrug efflux system)
MMTLLAGCEQGALPQSPTAPVVGVVILRSESATQLTELPGRVTAVETSEVRPQINGLVRKRLFVEGSLVHAGQALYQIDDAAYRAALATAQGNLANAQATIQSTRLQSERYERLAAINAVSGQDADNANASAQQARAGVQAMRAAVEAAQVNLDYTTIRAPISGRIGRSLVTVGALVQTGQATALTTIQRLENVYVDVPESAADLLNLRQAIQAGSVTRDGAGSVRVQLVLPNGATYPVEGKLEFSEVTVDQTSGSVTLRATFPNPKELLLPGMYVRAKLVEGVRQQVILAPQQGVTRNERGEAVAMVVGANNKVEQRTLTIAQAIGNRWIVTQGLKAGDRLIVEGLVNLQPGTVVQPRPPQQVTAPPAKIGS